MADLFKFPDLHIQVTTSPSTPQPLTRENVIQYTKDTATPLRKLIAQRPPSPQRTFMWEEKNYPRKQPDPNLSIQRAFANTSPSYHWRGDEETLFKLDPVAKYNIRDYLAGQCKVHNETTNELTKPTGTKIVFVLQFNDEDEEQQALCVPTTRVTLHGIYSFRDAENDDNIEPFESPALPTETMQIEAMRRLPSVQGTASFARLTAAVDEEDFPLTDRELDSDSDSEDGRRYATPSYASALDAITEDDEDEEANNGFVDVVDHGTPKYCRDPDSADHPECHGRFKSTLYAYSSGDAELDLQERFMIAQNGGTSTAYYRNWHSLKLDYGETMVHGHSSLRKAMATLDESEEGEELDDPTEQLLRLIAAKYGPLTLEGQRTKPAEPERECSAECISRVTKYLDQDLESDSWLSRYPFDDAHEELISEPSTLFDGVADFSEDDAPAPAPAASQNRVVTSLSEEELQKILDTPHEDFINHYVQRYEAMRNNAARAKQARNEVAHSAIPTETINDVLVVAVDTGPEKVTALPTIVFTAATPLSSPVEDVSPSCAVVDCESVTYPITDTLSVVSDPTSDKIEPLADDIILSAPAAMCTKEVAPQVLPAFVEDESVPVEASVRPVSAPSSYSSRYGSSLYGLVFSQHTSVTTKPSNESFEPDCLRLVNTIDLEVDVKSAPSTVSNHGRSVSMPTLTSSATDTCKTSAAVLMPALGAHARSTYVGSSTPIRTTIDRNKCLTPIIPLSTSLVPQATMHPIPTTDDSSDPFSTTSRYQHPNTHIPSQATRLSREEDHSQVQPIPASLFTDDSSFTSHWQRSNKLETLKHRAQTLSSAAKRVTRRVLRAAKKLRTTTRYFASAASGTRNPYETLARS